MEKSSIFYNSYTPMLVIDSESGIIRDGNLAASNYYGYTLEELKKLNISDINILSKQEILELMSDVDKAKTMHFCITKPFGKDQFYSVIEYILSSENKDVVYDLKPILETVDGDLELLKDIIDEVVSIQYEEEFLVKIENYIINKDLKSLAKQIHKVKGSISHFRIDTINNILLEMDEYCREGNFTSLNQLLIELQKEYINLKVFLTAYLKNIRD
jgi:hypothetical protein